MLKIEKAILASDLFPGHQSQINFTKTFCNNMKISTDVLHIFDPAVNALPSSEFSYTTAPWYNEYVREMRIDAKNALETEAKILEANPIFIEGNSYEEFDRFLESVDRNTLIILNSHEKTLMKKFPFGGFVQHCLQHSENPLMIIPNDYTGKSIERISCFTDLEETSFFGEQIAIGLSKQSGLPLNLVHCLPGLEEFYPKYYQPFLNIALLQKNQGEFRHNASKAFDDYVKNFEGKVEPVLLEGNIYKKMVEYLESKNDHLVVLGTHGYQGIDRFILGSIAQKILYHTNFPTIIAKSRSKT